ncbi:MAG: RidA family protein, partial [Mycobacterium sp.]
IIHLAGQTAVGGDGRHDPDDDLAAQTRKALANLTVALDAAGATPADLVALRVYVVNLERSMFPDIAAEVARFVGDAEPPPATWIGVTSLLSPRALIEIEGVAVV